MEHYVFCCKSDVWSSWINVIYIIFTVNKGLIHIHFYKCISKLSHIYILYIYIGFSFCRMSFYLSLRDCLKILLEKREKYIKRVPRVRYTRLNCEISSKIFIPLPFRHKLCQIINVVSVFLEVYLLFSHHF